MVRTRPSAHAVLLSVTSHITSHGPLCYGDWTLLILLNATDYNDALAPGIPQIKRVCTFFALEE